MIPMNIIGTPLFQWETGRQLQITPLQNMTVSAVHFSNPGDLEALVVKPKEVDGKIVADIPNILLQKGSNIVAYSVNVSSDCVETLRDYIFPVRKRAKPSDYVYTETEVMSYSYLDKRLDNLEGEGLAKAVEAYLEENPVEAGATKEEAAQIAQNKNDIADLKKDKLNVSELPTAVNEALAQAKASGEFDGKPGYTPVKGKDYFDGDDYILTPADKTEIAEMASELVDIPSLDGYAKTEDVPTDAEIIQLIKNNAPESSGGGISVTGATVGQTVKISAVDESGKPTAWEAVDFPSGGGEKKWRKLKTISFAEDAFNVDITEDDNGEPFSLSEVQFYFYTLKTGIATTCGISLLNNGSKFFIFEASSIFMTNYTQMMTRVHMYHDDIGYRCEQYSSYSGVAAGLSRAPIIPTENPKQNITGIILATHHSNAKFVAGSTIEIWGVDA